MIKRATLEEPTGKVHDLAKLVVEEGSELTVGRNEKNIIQFGMRAVSGNHALLIYNKESEKYSIKDLNSKNGTAVFRGDEKLEFESSKIIVLENGDQLFFGMYGPVAYSERD